MELDKLADYFFLQFKEIGGRRWQFEVRLQSQGQAPATLMAYPSAVGAKSHLEKQRRAGREARLVSVRGPDVSNIDGEQYIEIYGCGGFHQLKDVRQLFAFAR